MTDKTVLDEKQSLPKKKMYGGLTGFLTALGLVLRGKAHKAALEMKKENVAMTMPEKVYGLAFGGIIGFLAATALVLGGQATAANERKSAPIIAKRTFSNEAVQMGSQQLATTYTMLRSRRANNPVLYSDRGRVLGMVIEKMRESGLNKEQMLAYLRHRELTMRLMLGRENRSFGRQETLKRAIYLSIRAQEELKRQNKKIIVVAGKRPDILMVGSRDRFARTGMRRSVNERD